jgi:hypothetical protein
MIPACQLLVSAVLLAKTPASPAPWPLTELPVTTGGAGRPGGTILLTSFGGKGDGSTDNTGAFRKALAYLAGAGGGTLVVPNPSNAHVTGVIATGSDGNGGAVHVYRSMPIVISVSHITLRLEAGVQITAICDIPNWPIVPGFDSFIEGTDYAPFVSADVHSGFARAQSPPSPPSPR